MATVFREAYWNHFLWFEKTFCNNAKYFYNGIFWVLLILLPFDLFCWLPDFQWSFYVANTLISRKEKAAKFHKKMFPASKWQCLHPTRHILYSSSIVKKYWLMIHRRHDLALSAQYDNTRCGPGFAYQVCPINNTLCASLLQLNAKL